MDIIFDTNILRSDLMLRSGQFAQLKEYALKTGSVFILPQIVMEELKEVYRRELTNRLKIVKRMIGELNVISVVPTARLPLVDISDAVNAFMMYVRKEFSCYCLYEPKYTERNLRAAVQRLLSRVKPVSEKGEEFRDALLWEMIIDYFRFSSQKDIAFISDNVADFANLTKDDLHENLRTELYARGLNLHYYRSIRDFVHDRAKPFDFITEEWLINNLEWEKMDTLALDGVDRIHPTFYFESFYNLTKFDETLQTWRVMSANFNRLIDQLWITELAQKGHYSLNLYVGGKARIKFFLENGSAILRTVNFGTLMSVEFLQGKIVGFSLPFYEEESGLSLSD